MVNFAILALVAQFRPTSCYGLCRSLGTKYMWALIPLQLGCTPNAESCLQATMEIYSWGYFDFWLIFWVCQNTPFGTPISAPHVVN